MALHDLVVFDLDGTLNRTELYAVRAHQRTLEQFGRHLSEEDILDSFGASNDDFFSNKLPDLTARQRREYLDAYARYEVEELHQNKAAFPHVPEMLNALRDAGMRTAVCSNASVRYIRLVLTELGLLESIDYIQPIEPGLQKEDTLKKLLERAVHRRAVMVGDRFYDKIAAFENSLPFIGCAYGFAPKEVQDADIVVTDAAQIPQAVFNLLTCGCHDDQ